MIKTHSHTRAEHGGIYSVRGGDAKGVIDFSSNTGPLRSPAKVIAAIRHKGDFAFVYPDPDSKNICLAIGKHYKINEKSIIAGNGATEIIYEYARAFIKKGTKVLIQAPTFAEYESAAKLCGAKIITHKSMDLEKDSTRFINDIPRNGCVFVCNPNNPTGVLVRRKLVLEIAKAAMKKKSQLFVDECFMEFCARNESVIKNVTSHQNMFVVRTFTKLYGIPGIRIGYGIGNKNLIRTITNIKVPWSVSGFAQSVAIAALGCKEHVIKSRNVTTRETAYLQKAINAIEGLDAMPSMTNYILVKSTTHDSKYIHSRLARKKILVRDCSSFTGLGSSFIRIAARTRAQNKTLIEALESL